ncbi:MAG TPA: sensor histidine kinase [Bryobacteraceae bacterium]|nr:sensor histidine kinase [Bryobacteraceae bacterium]
MGSKTRLLLTWSLGGLVLLSAITGVTALVVFERIRAGDSAGRAQFARRSQWLERIRGGIYRSGTLARDYFVAPNEAGAPAMLKELRALEQDTKTAAGEYPDANLRGEVGAYWSLLNLMADMAGTRPTPGVDAYFRRQLRQRRETMLQIADAIGAALDREARRGESEFSLLYGKLRSVLAAEFALVISLGLIVAVGTGRRLVRVEAESRALSAELVRAQEQERRAIARELHDEIGQSLSSLLLDVGGAARLDNVLEVRTRLHSVAALAERSVEAVRRIALSLRPSMLDDLGLVPALEWQAREVGHRSGLTVQVLAEDSAGELPETHLTCIYRVAQEALQNCVRHAAANRVRIGLHKVAKTVMLNVEDDGKGFLTARTRGLGLLGMEERVAQLGGRFRVQSEPGRGTTVTAELPL